MRVGLTYDLRTDYLAEGYGEEETAEFDRPDTIEALERTLRALGHETERIGNVRRLAEALVAGRRWDLVFNVAEGLRGVGREAQVPGLLEAYDVPYTFADPLTASLTLHKGLTKRVLRDLGIATTDFRLVATEADLEAVDLPFPLFVKPVAEGTSKGITARSRVTDRPALGEQCRAVWRRFGQAAIVEPFLPGREVTVGIVGTGSEARALGTLEVVLLEQAEADACTYVNKERCEELLRYRLADRETAAEAEAAALAAWRGLGGRDGGRVDLRADREGRLQVMELNPLPGLHPEHSDLPILCAHAGVPYVDLIRAIVDSARRRAARAGG